MTVEYSHAESAHAFEPFDGYAKLRARLSAAR